jgi:hypothetical protein
MVPGYRGVRVRVRFVRINWISFHVEFHFLCGHFLSAHLSGPNMKQAPIWCKLRRLIYISSKSGFCISQQNSHFNGNNKNNNILFLQMYFLPHLGLYEKTRRLSALWALSGSFSRGQRGLRSFFLGL